MSETQECISSEDLASDPCWWSIYREAFPLEEREPEDAIVRGVERGVLLASRLRRDGRTVGIATAHLLMSPEVVFLVYLAIQPDECGQGLGPKLFEFAWKSAMEHRTQHGGRPRGMIWEIDPPATAASSAEADTRNRRIQFFQRLGGALLPHRYFQPPVGGIVVPMLLMARPASSAAMPGEHEVQAIIEAMYFEKYGAINGIPTDVLRQLLQSR